MAYSTTGNGGKSLPQIIGKAGVVFVCLASFFTPLSTSLLGLFSILATLAWLLSGGFLLLPRIIVSCPAALFAILLFLLMSLAISYSPAPTLEALETLKKYRELILLPIILTLLGGSRRHGELAVLCLMAGCAVLMVVSYGMAWHLVPNERFGHSVVFHITHSFFMAVLSFWALHRAIDSGGAARLAWLLVFIAAVVNLFYIAPGRTGMLVFICLISLFLVQRLSLKKTLAGLVILAASILFIYLTSGNFSGRVHEVASEIQGYEPGKSRTSIGQRFDWWYTSVQLIRERPLLGHGTGSFPLVQKRLTAESRITRTDNPHNEFLLITVQTGLVGLALFLGLFGTQIIHSFTLPAEKRMLLQGVVLALLSGCLMNSLLFDSQQGHFYLFMSAALMNCRGKETPVR